MLCALCPQALRKTPRDPAESHNVQFPISQFSATDRSKYCAAFGSTKHMLLPVALGMCRGTRTVLFVNRRHPDVFVLILKIRISQNISIYCQYVSWQLVSTIYSLHQASNEP